jgi:hypothetical protein
LTDGEPIFAMISLLVMDRSGLDPVILLCESLPLIHGHLPVCHYLTGISGVSVLDHHQSERFEAARF